MKWFMKPKTTYYKKIKKFKMKNFSNTKKILLLPLLSRFLTMKQRKIKHIKIDIQSLKLKNILKIRNQMFVKNC